MESSLSNASHNASDLIASSIETKTTVEKNPKDTGDTQNDDVTTENSNPNAAFADLSLSSHEPLTRCVRTRCTGGCGKQRRYYCSDCVLPLIQPASAVPNVKLPLHIHVLQSGAERPQQSTAQHVKLLAPTHTKIWRPFPECAAEFRASVIDASSPGQVAVLYPCDGALSPEEAAAKLPKLTDLVVLDATWTKSALLMKDQKWMDNLPKVILPAGTRSRFWRYAPLRSEHSMYFSPEKVPCLVSTVEAVHRFCNVFAQAKGQGSGSCDDLLWLFAFLHQRVRDVYQNSPGKRERIMRKSKGLLNHF